MLTNNKKQLMEELTKFLTRKRKVIQIVRGVRNMKVITPKEQFKFEAECRETTELKEKIHTHRDVMKTGSNKLLGYVLGIVGAIEVLWITTFVMYVLS